MRVGTGIVLLALATLLCACQKRPAEPAPTVIPQEFRVGVAWFTQPTSTRELVTGRLPETQGRINPGFLAELDGLLARTLAQHSPRQYRTLIAPANGRSMEFHESGSPMGLEYWLNAGRKADVDLLLVPQVIDWRERDGGEAGVARGAAVRVDFYLIDVARARVLKRSVFEEEQVGLTDNLLTVGQFFKRRARWVSAEELSAEGMLKAIREFGL
jgi:hypothetical protein